MPNYFDKVIRGTEREDGLVLLQFFKGKIGQTFSFLGYYKEIPVSYDGKLVSVENEMAEFEVHEYQAKVMDLERKTLIQNPDGAHFSEDIFAEAFYVNVAKKRVILCKFAFAKINSGMRKYVRVILDKPIDVDVILEKDVLRGHISDLSLGGAAMMTPSNEQLESGQEVTLFLKLPGLSNAPITEVGLKAKLIRIKGEVAPYTCFLEFHSEKMSQQAIAYFINQRQVEIIKELRELIS